MGYKYRNGGTPDHVDSSQSNSTTPQVGAFSDSTQKAKQGLFPDSSSDVEKKRKDANDYISGGHNGFGGEFNDAELDTAATKVKGYEKSRDINNSNASKRSMMASLMSKTKAQADATSVKKK